MPTCSDDNLVVMVRIALDAADDGWNLLTALGNDRIDQLAAAFLGKVFVAAGVARPDPDL